MSTKIIEYILTLWIILTLNFFLPGLLMREAVLMHDYPLIQGIFLLVTVCVLTANYLADWVYGWLDPRVCIGKTKMFLHIN
jgi:ABC-type dipeptide/oligopeptide/nickel transport system permease component